jgi:predicted NAD-dependent protein-ADP-ribosyltransferase YbiA (DUF1768 family)
MTQRRHGSSPCVQVRIAHGASSLHQVQLQAVEANQLGRTIRETDMRPNWNAECDKYMLDILRKKFHSPEWTRRLLSTGSDLLVDGNLHHDNHWGICDCLSVADSSSCRSAPNSPPK